MTTNNNMKPQLFKTKIDDSASWDEWLEKTEELLKSNGYKKYNQILKSEDFAYWKIFHVNNKKAYQAGVLFYDLRKYEGNFNVLNYIGVQFECMLINADSRIDMSANKEITVKQFEKMSRDFYNAMSEYA